MFATCAFNANIFLLLGNGGTSGVEFTGVELVGGAELVAPVEKATAGRSDGEDGYGR